MKLSLIFVIIFVTFVNSITAQRCAGSPRNPSCGGDLDLGRGGRGCVARNMWYFDANTRRCRPMRYEGCGGNNNRWCTRGSCQARCGL